MKKRLIFGAGIALLALQTATTFADDPMGGGNPPPESSSSTSSIAPPLSSSSALPESSSSVMPPMSSSSATSDSSSSMCDPMMGSCGSSQTSTSSSSSTELGSCYCKISKNAGPFLSTTLENAAALAAPLVDVGGGERLSTCLIYRIISSTLADFYCPIIVSESTVTPVTRSVCSSYQLTAQNPPERTVTIYAVNQQEAIGEAWRYAYNDEYVHSCTLVPGEPYDSYECVIKNPPPGNGCKFTAL